MRAFPPSSFSSARMSLPRLQPQGSLLYKQQRATSSISSRSAASTLSQNKGKANHHVTTSNSLFTSTSLSQDPVSTSSRLAALFSPTSLERFQRLVPQAFGADYGGMGEDHFVQNGGGRGGRGSGRAGRGSGGRGRNTGLGNGEKSSEESVPTLAICIQDAENTSYPSSIALCMLSLAQRVNFDTRGGVQYSSVECADIVVAARKLMRQLLGTSSSSGAPASTERSPVLQLDSKHLSQLAWSLSVMVAFDESLSATAQQLSYALAERAGQPRFMRRKAQDACRSWAGLLYGLAKVGVQCSDDARVKHAFHICMEQDLPDLLLKGHKCVPQDVSMVSIACVDAGYEGGVEPLISALARRVGDPNMGGVYGGLMASAKPQAWSNLINACAKLEQRGIMEGEGVDEGMGIIADAGAAAMAGALQRPVKYQPKPQELANTLWGLSHFEWYDARIIRVLAHAMVGRIDSCKPLDFSHVLWALAKFGWYDKVVVSKLAAGLVKHIGSSVPQNISNTLWALSTLGWYDSGVYDALLVVLLDRRDQLNSQALKDAIYSCALASHGGSTVDELAQMISRQDVSKEGGWAEQELSNSLYAWVVLDCVGIASDSLNTMAQHLMREVNDRGSAAFQKLQLRQLYLAHLEAEREGLHGGGLSAGNGMLQAASEQHAQYRAELRTKARQSGGTAGVRQAAAALQDAGYEVEMGGGVGHDEYHVDMLVHHALSPIGIAVDMLSDTDMFRHPSGQLSGKAKLKHAQIRQRCNGLVVLSEGDAKQPGLVVQRVEEEMKSVPGFV